MTPSDLAGATACAVAVCLLAGTARASEELDEAAARALFAEGRKLAADGDYAAACPKFEESFRLDPGIGTGFNLADCWEHTGRTASAWARFLGVAAAAKALGQGEREAVARARAAALEPHLSRLVVTVTAPVPGLTVKRDAIPVGPASWGVPVPVDPGEHAIEATAPRKKSFSVSVRVDAVADVVSVAISPLEDEPAPAPPPPAPAPTAAGLALGAPPPGLSREAPSRSPVPSIAIAALGAASLAAGALFGLEFQSVNADAKKLCPTNLCTQNEKDDHTRLVDEARRDLNLAYVGAAVGGVALVTAALLWWRPGPLKPAPASARLDPALRAYASRDGAGVGIEGRW